MKKLKYWIFLWMVIALPSFVFECHAMELLDEIGGDDEPNIVFEVIPSHTEVVSNTDGVIAVILDIPWEYHIQDDLDVELEGADGIETGEIVKPEGTFDDTVKAVFYYGKTYFALPFKAGDRAEKGERNITAKIYYSPCTEKLCLGRYEKEVVFTITVGGEDVKNPAFAAVEGDVPKKEVAAEESETEQATGLEEKISGALEKGSWIVFLLVFVGGIATSFTPCVFPMIPITVSYFGSRATGSMVKGFFMSLMYVLGIVITYSILGVIAGATGAAFGSFAEHPVVIIVIVAIFLVLAASMFGAFELQLPAVLRNKLGTGTKAKSVLAPLLLGLVLGFIAAPCIGPVIIAIMTYIARKQSIIYGFWLMFFFASGMGVLFVIIGTFSGTINRLPKSGMWMIAGKKIFGMLMIAMAVYFARPLFSPWIYGYIASVTLIIFGIFAGAFTRLSEPTVWDKIRKVAAVVVAVVGIYGLVINMMASGLFIPPGMRFGPANAEGRSLEVEWTRSFEGALNRAKAENKPIIVDFYAENCPACIEMDRFTYSNPEVVKASKKFVPLKLYSNDNRDIVKRYGILGYPAAVFLRPDGTQTGETAYGFIEAKEFLKLMDEVTKEF